MLLPGNATIGKVVIIAHRLEYTNSIYSFHYYNFALGNIYKAYNSASLRNDIELVCLDQPAEINSFLSPICLSGGDAPKVGEICYATEFGAIR